MELTPAAGEERRSLELLIEVGRIASLGLELRPMLQRITDTLLRKFDCQFIALVSIDPERQVFVCEAMSGPVDTAIHIGYNRPLGSGVVGEVATTGRSVLIDDVHTWPNYVETMPGTQSELCVPVKHHGKIVAILNLESVRPAAFRGQLELLETVADQISGAIASAQLYEELQQRARLMQLMSEVSRTALQATDLEELLQRIVLFIREHFPLAPSIVMYEAGEGGDVPREMQLTSDLVIPIRFHDAVLGVLNLKTTSGDVFTPANVLAFEAFADQVAGAINMAAVNERLAEATRQLEAKTRALEGANEHLAKAVETLHRLSSQDGLTGVANRRHFDETLAGEWRRAARRHSTLSLLMLDIDFFKAFNDRTGHQAGDECLRRVAQTLRDALQRSSDLVARYGGEEFAVLLPETDGEHAHLTATMLLELVVALQIQHPSSPYGHLTVSIGVASVIPGRDGGAGAQQFVGAADAALYEAKRQGRNRIAG